MDKPLASDSSSEPTQYWDPAAPPDEPDGVEIATLNWDGVRSYHLYAFPDEGKIAYEWSVDGDGSAVPPGLDPTEQPMASDDLLDVLEINCLPEFSDGMFENAWDQAWYAAQDNLDLSDSEAMGYALDNVSEAYTFRSDFYPTLSNSYYERFQAWRNQQKPSEE